MSLWLILGFALFVVVVLVAALAAIGRDYREAPHR